MWNLTPEGALLSTGQTDPLATIESLIELLEIEGLTHNALSSAYGDATNWCTKLGRYEQAKMWAQKQLGTTEFVWAWILI